MKNKQPDRDITFSAKDPFDLNLFFLDSFKKGNVLELDKIWNNLPASFCPTDEIIENCFYAFLSNENLYESFKFICQKGINLDNSGFMSHGLLYEAVFQDNVLAAELLIQSGANINLVHHLYDDTPVFNIKSKKMLAVFQKYEADFNVIDSEGDTLLHSLITKKISIDIIKEIIENTNFNLLYHLNKHFKSILDIAILTEENNDQKFNTMIYLYNLHVPYNEKLLNSSLNESSILFQKYILSQNKNTCGIKNKCRI